MPWPLHDVGPHQPHPKRRLCLAQHLREPPPDAPRTASTTAPLGHHRASPVHAAPVHAGLPRHLAWPTHATRACRTLHGPNTTHAEAVAFALAAALLAWPCCADATGHGPRPLHPPIAVQEEKKMKMNKWEEAEAAPTAAAARSSPGRAAWPSPCRAVMRRTTGRLTVARPRAAAAAWQHPPLPDLTAPSLGRATVARSRSAVAWPSQPHMHTDAAASAPPSLGRIPLPPGRRRRRIAPCQAAAPHPPFAPCQHVSGHDEPRHHCMAAPHSLAAGCRRAAPLCRRPAEPLHRTDARAAGPCRVKLLGWPPPLARALAAPPPPPLCHRRHRHQRRKEKGKRKERKEKREGIF